MNNFNEGGGRKFSGDFKKRSFRDRGESDRGGRGSFNRDRGDRPEMFKTICSECGQSCEVPFKPSGSKPVYCSNCFKRDKAPTGNFRSERPHFHSDSPRPESNFKFEEKLEAMNAKLEKIMKYLAPAVQAIKNIDLDTPGEIVDSVKQGVNKVKQGAQTINRETKNIKKETKELRGDIIKDAKTIKKEVIKDVKKIGKTVTKDIKKIKKEVKRVVKNVNTRNKKK